MNLQPLEDRIVVRPAEAEETTISGLVIPDTAKEKPQQGEVLAVGPGRRAENTGELIAMELAAGDTVVYSKYGGTEITIDGEDVLILSSRDVLAKVGKEEEVARRSRSTSRRSESRAACGPPVLRYVRTRSCAGRGFGLGPLVVGLAVRAAADLGNEHETARPLVVRERVERRGEVGSRQRRAATAARPPRSRLRRTARRACPPRGSRPRRGARFTASSTSSGYTFSPPRVDARRAAAEEHDRAVGLDASRSRRAPTSAAPLIVRNVASDLRSSL